MSSRPSEPPDQAYEELVEAWFILQDAHLTLEGETRGSPMYRERLDVAMDATRKYYRVLERISKEGQEK